MVVVVVVVQTLLYDMNVSPLHTNAHAPNWSGRSSGSKTPGDQATPSPRVHRTLQAHLQPPDMHLHHPTEQAEHLHHVHDLWHDTPISSTPRETATAIHRSFLHAEPPGLCRCTQRACERPCPSTNTTSCNCGIAAVCSPTAPENAGSSNRHRTPCQ